MLKRNKEKYNDYLLELALKKDLLDKFIAGTGFFEITAPQGMNVPPSYSASETMQTIYRKYEKDNKQNIPLLTQNAFYKIFDEYKSRRIVNAINAINYHMSLEKDGKAPFKLDCQTILEKARENLINNKDLFQNGEYSFWDDLENADKNLNESHGIHIL